MKKIQLTQGMSAFVDDDDYHWLSCQKWHAVKCNGKWYARRHIGIIEGERVKEFMHRLIMKSSAGREIDHVDGNGLNNCRENLRAATHQENMRNRGAQKNNASGLKGVHYRKDRGTYRARIVIDGNEVFLGSFHSSNEAALAYQEAQVKHFGAYAKAA